jgi:hypothetical protein
MKRILSGDSNMGHQKRKPDPLAEDTKEKEGAFPKTTSCLMIFGGTTTYD